jgi:hypothetical protein
MGKIVSMSNANNPIQADSDASRRRFLARVAAAVGVAAVWPGGARAQTHHLIKRAIPGNDETLGVIGLGNSPAFSSDDRELSRRLLNILSQRGGSVVDARGQSRFTVLAAAPQPADVFLSAYVDGSDIETDRSDLRALRDIRDGRPVDLISISNVDELQTRWANLRRLQDDGLARYIGIASWRAVAQPAMLELMPTGMLDFVQVPYSALERDVEDHLLPMAMEHEVAVVTNRPFMNGRYFTLVRNRSLPDWATDFGCASWAQFSLKFIVSHPAVTCALTETSNPKHALDNMGGGIGELPDQDARERMARLLKGFV